MVRDRRTDHERTTDARARRSAAARLQPAPGGFADLPIRTLGADDLQTLIDYERSHAKRVQVMAVMENRPTSLGRAQPPAGPGRGHTRVGTGRGSPGRRPRRLRRPCRSTCRPTATRATRASPADPRRLAKWWRSGADRHHFVALDGLADQLKAAIMSMTAGPSSTMNRVGRMQRISGKITFTGICIAFSSAR